jgi:hypothetical protein
VRFNKPCLACGTLSLNNYCEPCDKSRKKERDTDPIRVARKKELYGPRYRRLAKIVRDNATQCHICHEGYRVDDPWEADHLYPDLGDASPLAPAHRTCNQQRGNKPLNT